MKRTFPDRLLRWSSQDHRERPQDQEKVQAQPARRNPLELMRALALRRAASWLRDVSVRPLRLPLLVCFVRPRNLGRATKGKSVRCNARILPMEFRRRIPLVRPTGERAAARAQPDWTGSRLCLACRAG